MIGLSREGRCVIMENMDKREIIFGVVGSISAVVITAFLVLVYNGRTMPTINTATTSTPKALTLGEVGKHNTPADCWIIVDGSVYNATDYAIHHPGGERRIFQFCGRDASVAFTTKDGQGSHSGAAWQDLEKLLVGKLQ